MRRSVRGNVMMLTILLLLCAAWTWTGPVKPGLPEVGLTTTSGATYDESGKELVLETAVWGSKHGFCAVAIWQGKIRLVRVGDSERRVHEVFGLPYELILSRNGEDWFLWKLEGRTARWDRDPEGRDSSKFLSFVVADGKVKSLGLYRK